MTDLPPNVSPFRRRGPAPPRPPSPAKELAKQQAVAHRAGYERAAAKQEEARLLAEGTPVPARITLALDARGLYGPEVDISCGAVEPAVDNWEAGIEVPTAEQVKLLAALTGYPIRSFYLPAAELQMPSPVFICDRGKTKHGLTLAYSYIDERGVLHREFAEPSRGGAVEHPGGQP